MKRWADGAPPRHAAEAAETIDLCDSPTELYSGSSSSKRRRLGSLGARGPPSMGVPTIELSDEDESEEDARLARRLQEEERERFDEQMARRLQEHETSIAPWALARAGPPPMPRGMPSGGAMLHGFAAGFPQSRHLLDVFGDEPEWLASERGAMLPPLPAWQVAPGARAFGGGRGGSQLARLSMMDRDFGEADYEMLLRLDEDNGRAKKTRMRENSKLVDQLPSHRASKAEAREELTCAICLENIRAQQSVTTLPCKHEYHRSCIGKWLKSTEAASCPQCKAPALEPPSGDAGADADAGAVSTADQWWHT